MRRTRWWIVRLAAVSLIALTGCTHVRLQLPPADAEFTVRKQAYLSLRPVGRYRVEEYRGALTQDAFTQTLVLGDGREVANPVDLLPAVRPESQTAAFIEVYRRRRDKGKLWGGLAVGGFLGGLAVVASTFVIPYPREAEAYIVLSGLAVGLVGSLMALIIGAVAVGNTDVDRERCFSAYDADLRDALGVVVPDE